MKTRKMGLSVVFLAVLFAILPQMASAALYGGWSPTPNIPDSETDWQEGPNGSSDITGIWYAQDGGNHFFRMDLGGEIVAGGDHADMYNIYVTSTDPGPGIPPESYPFPSNLVSMMAIDFSLGGDPLLIKYASFTPNGGDSVSIPFLLTNAGDGDSATLEWSVPLDQLIGPFWYMGATIYGGDPESWDDISGARASAVPIPSAAWLLGTGIIGLVGLKRRQSKRR